jgi:hypothetical protein
LVYFGQNGRLRSKIVKDRQTIIGIIQNWSTRYQKSSKIDKQYLELFNIGQQGAKNCSKVAIVVDSSRFSSKMAKYGQKIVENGQKWQIGSQFVKNWSKRLIHVNWSKGGQNGPFC